MNSIERYERVTGEVLLHLKSHPILVGGLEPNEGEELISDAGQAWKLATSQDPPDGFECWTDLRERNYTAKLPSLDRVMAKEDTREEFEKMTANFNNQLYKLLNGYVAALGLDKRIAGVIGVDYTYLTQMRSFSTKPHEWAERMGKVYERGGWPCGWHGKFPSGRLVVFAPGK
jgi:hypothetical protein